MYKFLISLLFPELFKYNFSLHKSLYLCTYNIEDTDKKVKYNQRRCLKR